MAPDGKHPPEDPPQRRFYGRRSGRKLRPAQQRLIDEALPALAVSGETPIADLDSVFGRPVEAVWMEIGFGGGEHLEAQARANPDIGFIGCEPYINGVASLLSRLRDEGDPGNIRLHADDARDLMDALPDASIGRLFVLFPDPWPKTRQQKRRIIGPDTLDSFARILTPGAELRAATDDMGYAAWILEHLRAHGEFQWIAAGPEDWRTRPEGWVPTRYEQKALAAGSPCVYLRFRRCNP